MAEQQVSVVAVLRDRLSGPMGKVSASLTGVGTALSSLRARFSPVLNQFTALASVVGVVAAAQKSLSAAQQADQSEARLRAATGDRVALQKDLIQLTKQLQKETNFEDEALADAAASMLRIGIAAEDIPRSLRAAANFAVAFKLPVESVAQALGSIEEGGSGRALQRLVPALAGVVKEGASLAEVLDLLEQKSAGAAESMTSTVFGRIRGVELAIGDTSERIGAVLAKIKLSTLQVLQVVVEKIADALESPAFGVFVGLLARAADHAGVLAAGLGGVVAVVAGLAGVTWFAGLAANLVAVGTALAPVIAALASVAGIVASAAGGFALLGAGLAGAVVLLLQATGLLGDFAEGLLGIFDGAKDLAAQFGSIVKKIAAGRLGVEDLWDFVRTKFQEAGVFIDAAVFEPVRAGIGMVKDLFVGAFTTVKATAGFVLGSAIDFVADTAIVALRFVVGNVDAAVEVVRQGLVRIDDALGTDLAFDRVDLLGNLPEEFTALDRQLSVLKVEMEEGAEQFSGAWQRATLRVVSSAAAAGLEISRLDDALQERLRLAEEQRVRQSARDVQHAVEDESLKLGRLAEDALAARRQVEDALRFQHAVVRLEDLVDVDQAEVRNTLRAAAEDSRDALRAILEARLDEQLRAGRISAEQFLQLRREAETGLLQDQEAQQVRTANAARAAVAAYSEELAQVRQLAEAEQARGDALARAPGMASAEALVESRKKLRDLVEHEGELLGKIGDKTRVILEAEKKRGALAVDLAKFDQGELGVRTKLADEALAGARRAGELARDEAKRTAALLQAGAIGQDEALLRTRDSSEQLARALADARLQVGTLLAGEGVRPGALQAELEAAQRALDDLGGIQVELQVELGRGVAQDLRQQLAESSQVVDELVASGAVGFERASDRVAQALDIFDRGVAEVRKRVAALSARSDLTPAQVDELRLLRHELEALEDARAEPRLGLADAIERQVSDARQRLDEGLQGLEDAVGRRELLPAEAAERASRMVEAWNVDLGDAREAVLELAAAQPELAAQLDLVIERLERQRKVLPKPQDTGDFFGGVQEGAQRTAESLGNLNETGKQVGEQLTGGLADGLVDVFVRSRQSFGEFLREFVAGIAIMIARAVAFRAISAAFGFNPTTTVNSGGLILGPGLVARFEEGGLVPGPRTHRDGVRALLTPGELVVPEAAVERLVREGGWETIAHLLRGRLPWNVGAVLAPAARPVPVLATGYAGGGVVAGGRRARVPDGGSGGGVLLANEQTMDKLLAGGAPAFWRFLGSHRGRARGELNL